MVCLNCNSSSLDKLDLHNDRRKGLSGFWSIYKCEQCGMMAIYPSPSESELTEYYSVYSLNKSVTYSQNIGSQIPFLRKLYHWISGAVDPRDFIKIEANSTVLDYGCGEAGCLFDFHSQGIKISGAEISSILVDNCQNAGLDVRQVTNPNEIPFENNAFDIVYLMQVFEHLRNPHVFMNELNRILKPGGFLFLAVPNSNSIWRNIFGKNWVSGWFVPFHLFHYNKKSISELANQHGFNVLESWSRTPESWFRLNLKAFLYPKEMLLDERQSIIDSILLRIPLMLLLRIIEIFIIQRDCLVIKLEKTQLNYNSQ